VTEEKPGGADPRTGETAPSGPDRRATLIWAGSVAAALGLGGGAYLTFGVDRSRPVVQASGYGLDPNLTSPHTPWPRTLSADQLGAIAAVCDVILPADGTAPSASKIGVQAMIDEWISAPYPDQTADRGVILAGLTWMDDQARRQGARGFAAASQTIRDRILASLTRVGAPAASPPPGDFFARMHRLTIGGYYTTEAGFKDIGYIGNQSLSEYPEPSKEVEAALQHAYKTLGL
jgi:Gluconate 2-dehydrogenase subunit 3